MNVRTDQLRPYPRSAAFGGREPPRGLDLAEILDTLRRRRGAAALAMLLCLACAILYVATATPLFTATAILVTDTKMSPPSPAQVSAEGTIDPAVVESQIGILKSDKIALDVVDRLDLTRDPEFVGRPPTLFDRLISLLRIDAAPGGTPDLRHVAAGALDQKLKVTRSGRSFLAEIKATSIDPRKAAAIVNAVAEAYIQDQLSSRLESGQRTTEWMQQRLVGLRQRAAQADEALRQAHERAEAGRQDAAARDPASARDVGSDPARQRLRAVEGAQRSLEGDAAPATFDALGDAEAKRLAQAVASGDTGAREALRARLGVLEDEARHAASIAELRTDLLKRRGEDAASAERTQTPDAQEERLRRAAEAARSNVETLQNRVARVSAFLQQQAIPVTEARLVTAAAPPLSKSSPKTTVTLLLAFAGGAALAVTVALLRDLLDRRVRWPHQITRELSQPYLGALPPAQGRRRQGGLPVPLLVGGRAPSLTALETLRSVKMMVDQTTGRDRCSVVGIVSALDGEGKTTLASNLAVLLADMHARVLVIDANLHDIGFSRALAGTEEGLAAVIADGRPLADAAVPTPAGFDLLPGAVEAACHHPAEQLASTGMRRLLTEARDTYDYVIVRIPAVLCAVDIRAIEDAIDVFVLVVASGRTRLEDVEGALASCPALADRTVGAVLNRSKLAPRRGARRLPATLRALGARA